jgi:hypothetical protein
MISLSMLVWKSEMLESDRRTAVDAPATVIASHRMMVRKRGDSADISKET